VVVYSNFPEKSISIGKNAVHKSGSLSTPPCIIFIDTTAQIRVQQHPQDARSDCYHVSDPSSRSFRPVLNVGSGSDSCKFSVWISMPLI
jgi:hypothetical protein